MNCPYGGPDGAFMGKKGATKRAPPMFAAVLWRPPPRCGRWFSRGCGGDGVVVGRTSVSARFFHHETYKAHEKRAQDVIPLSTIPQQAGRPFRLVPPTSILRDLRAFV